MAELAASIPPPSGSQRPILTESALLALLEHTDDVFAIVDETGRRAFLSPAVESLLGYPREELLTRSAFELVHPEDRANVAEAFARGMEQPGVPQRMEYRARRKDGTFAHIDAVGVNLLHRPDVRGIVVTSRDVTAARVRDRLTGAYSRLGLLERVAACSREPNATYALLVIGIAHVLEVLARASREDIEGALRALSKRLHLACGPEDSIGLLENQRFVVLSPGAGSVDGAHTLVNRIRRGLSEPLQIGARSMKPTCAFGIALTPENRVSPSALLGSAEAMLDRAISRGRGRVEVFEPVLSDLLLSKMHLESDLYEAIANDELLLHYQPIVDAQGGCVKGFEALVRWQKPDGRMISPGEFIPVAEESGAIRDLDEWVLRRACRQVRAFLDVNPNVYVSVNVSADQFANPNLVPGVLLALSQNGIPGSALQLEITESALVQKPDAGVLVMRELREHGIRFALDDFGTGYSSLGYLKMFPFDTLKIDRSFVRQITAPKGRPALVKAIVALALALDLDVVAEGVESRDELAFLQAERCERVQGFLFSAGVPPERALEILNLGSLAS